MNAPSTLLHDVEITGTLTFQGELNFDGQLRGGDLIGETLIIGPKAHIEGNIQAGSLVLHGSITGDVLVTGRCELKGSANLVGSLTTNRLVMDEGATLIGKAEITPDTKSRPLPPRQVPVSGDFPTGVASLKPQRP
jgi:cytoskeletal protein CcmA (bactofilin family)